MSKTKDADSVSPWRGLRLVPRLVSVSARGIAVSLATFTTFLLADAASALDAQGIATFKRQAVSKMCAGGADWLRCFSVDPLQCESISERLVDSCVGEMASLQAGAPDDINTISQTAQSFYTCLHSKFLASYGARKIASIECSEVDS